MKRILLNKGDGTFPIHVKMRETSIQGMENFKNLRDISLADFLPLKRKSVHASARKIWEWRGRGRLARGVPSSRWRELRRTVWPKVIYAAFSCYPRGRGGANRLTSDTHENKSWRFEFFKKRWSSVRWSTLSPREFNRNLGVCAEGETSFPLSGPSNLLLLFPLCVCCTFDADEIVI